MIKSYRSLSTFSSAPQLFFSSYMVVLELQKSVGLDLAVGLELQD